MAKIPKSFIDDLLNRVDVVDVISARVTLKKAGRNYQANCPFHDEKTPSFTVSEEKQLYHCFGCGANGNSIGFLMNYENLSFVEAIEELAKQAGVSVPKVTGQSQQPKMEVDPYALLDDCAKFYEAELKQSSIAKKYVGERGLTDKVIQQFRIGYAPDKRDSLIKKIGTGVEVNKALKTLDVVGVSQQQKMYDRFWHRLMFPIQDRRGRVLGFGARVIRAEDQPKYLNTSETPVFRKREELYGLYQCLQVSNKPECLLVTEGYMDVVALHQAGLPIAVAAMGTAVSTQQLTHLFRYTKRVVMCFDGDVAGQSAANKVLKNILPAMKDAWKVQFLILPKGEDPDSYVKQQGKEAFQSLLNQALGMTDFVRQDIGSLGEVGRHEDLPSMIKVANDWLQLCPQNAWQEALLKSIAEYLNVSPSVLNFNQAGSDKRKSNQSVSAPIVGGRPLKRKLNDEQKILTLILNFPTLIQELDAEGIDSLSSISPILSNVISMLMLKSIPGSAIVRHWENTANEQLLKELLMYDNPLNKEQSLAELKHLIERFNRYTLSLKWDKIHKKVQLLGVDCLTEEEKESYRNHY